MNIDIFKSTPVLSELLRKRGIEGDAELEEFLSPSPKLAYDPFLLANMHAGVDLLLDAIYSGSKIVIYGDYDCDGVTSTALLMKVIGSLTDNVTYYIPSRLDEGYGLNKSTVTITSPSSWYIWSMADLLSP